MCRARVRRGFAAQFKGAQGVAYASPGRFNLIGEHTDYNGSYVFPGAIAQTITAEIRPNGTEEVCAVSLDMHESVRFGLHDEAAPAQQWAKYIYGVCREIEKRGGRIGGFDTAFSGDIPLGAGLSSSAALESVYAFGLNDLFALGMERLELAKIGQSAEHNYCGVQCGIMDQFASLFGKSGQLLLLDCRSLEYRYVPFHPAGYRLVLLDTLVKHALASSAYNQRRQSCERVVALLRRTHPEVAFLRDATLAMLQEVKSEASAEDCLRAQYVIEETQRVKDVCAALDKGDYATVGEKMYATHRGMSQLYAVSCEELDFLNDIAQRCGVTGSRVMGGGFGGCTLNLVKADRYDAFVREACAAYAKAFGREPKRYDVEISDGARKLR